MNWFTALIIPLFWIGIRAGVAQAVEASEKLTVVQMQRDIDILQASLQALHPGLYRYNSAQQIEQYFRQLRHQTSRPLPIQLFYLRLSQLTNKIHCGHTYPNPFNLKQEVRSQLFSDQLLPVYFRVCAGQWLVTHNLSNSTHIARGDEIIAINNISVHQIMDSLLTVSRSDGCHGEAKKIDNLNLTPAVGATYALFDQYFSLFFPSTHSEFTLTIRSDHDSLFRLKVAALSKAERQSRFEQRFGLTPKKQSTWQYSLIIKQTGYLKIGDLAIWGWSFDARRYLDSVFTSIEQHHCTQLVVDIRGCEGGDDDIRNELLSYLMPRPFGCRNPTRRLYRSLAVPDSLQPYLQTWDSSFKQPKSANEYRLTTLGLYEKQSSPELPCQPISLKANRFKGRLSLLIDAANSSTTFTMADWIQQDKAGVLVGSPTGGTKQGLNGGQFFFLHLPDSQIEIDIPLIYQAPPQSQPDQGVHPDHLVNCQREAIIEGTDAVLQDALSKLAGMR